MSNYEKIGFKEKLKNNKSLESLLPDIKNNSKSPKKKRDKENLDYSIQLSPKKKKVNEPSVAVVDPISQIKQILEKEKRNSPQKIVNNVNISALLPDINNINNKIYINKENKVERSYSPIKNDRSVNLKNVNNNEHLSQLYHVYAPYLKVNPSNHNNHIINNNYNSHNNKYNKYENRQKNNMDKYYEYNHLKKTELNNANKKIINRRLSPLSKRI